MLSLLAGPVTKLAGDLIDNLFETDEEKANAKAKLIKLEQEGKLKTAEVQLSAIIAEAKSADPYTSRGRPTFLYVMYIMILTAIPMGVLFALAPDTANAVIDGAERWLTGIPDELWTLFGVGYLGYTGARSWDKNRKGIR